MRNAVLAMLAGAAAVVTSSPTPAAAADIVNIPAGEGRLADLIRAEHLRVCGTSLTLVVQHQALDRWRARDMLDRNYFGHRIPGGTYYWDHFRRFGIEDWVSPYASEILATNTYVASDYSGGTRAYNDFMDSAPHRGAIRNCTYNTFGVGAYREGSRRDFAVTFSRQPTERTTMNSRVRTGPGTSYDTIEIVPVATRQIVFLHRSDSNGHRWDSGYVAGVAARGWVPDSSTK
jgi:hypothetical protein